MPYQVLAVDDDSDVLGPMERCLRLRGFDVFTATSAEAALALCDEHSFDLVILDFIMPGTDGLELLARIRKVCPLARSVVISGQLDRSYKWSARLDLYQLKS
jgi:DNA-binding response OmpR family regulator